jgi:hypothetical protein
VFLYTLSQVSAYFLIPVVLGAVISLGRLVLGYEVHFQVSAILFLSVIGLLFVGLPFVLISIIYSAIKTWKGLNFSYRIEWALSFASAFLAIIILVYFGRNIPLGEM